MLILFLIIIIILVYLEFIQNIKPESPLKIEPKDWKITKKNHHIKANGWIEIYNPHQRMEIMIPEFKVSPTLLSYENLNYKNINIRIIPHHPDFLARKDNYWESCIVKSRSLIRVNIIITIEIKENDFSDKDLEALWIDVIWQNYGPFGYLNKQNGFLVPISIPAEENPTKIIKILDKTYLLKPIKTHLLGRLDSPYDVLKQYCAKIVKPGDILTIGETPLAIMQGRYTSPRTVKITLLARMLCHNFHPTSSLATACGMQSLINLIGPSRTIIAWFIGASLKLIGIKGFFYRLAGEQARLIDDITGTTPPYDKTIVLGPINQKEFCSKASKSLGIDVAIVDVNDLGRVKVLSSNNKTIDKVLYKALQNNPAGNANEHTPIVLIRPYNENTSNINIIS
tara:strand:- start:4492 stop:5682 length:1191 start_codon:yes stop_codon:yes gene_type:complete